MIEPCLAPPVASPFNAHPIFELIPEFRPSKLFDNTLLGLANVGLRLEAFRNLSAAERTLVRAADFDKRPSSLPQKELPDCSQK
jgi:hypothetical protein